MKVKQRKNQVDIPVELARSRTQRRFIESLVPGMRVRVANDAVRQLIRTQQLIGFGPIRKGLSVRRVKSEEKRRAKIIAYCEIR